MIKEFAKKCQVLISYMAMTWFEYHVSIYSRIYGTFHTLLSLSLSIVSRSKLHNVKSTIVGVIKVSQYVGYYSKRLLYGLITIRKRPQSLFQFMMAIAACLVIVSIINQNQLPMSYIDYILYSSTIGHNQSNNHSTPYIQVKESDNETNYSLATRLGSKSESKEIDSIKIPTEGQEPLNIINIPMNDKKVIRDVTVAVLDTGIDRKHEDLGDKVVGEVDFTKNRSTNDRNGHGTHIAGIIAADAANGLGLIGVAPQAKLLNVKVADVTGMCQKSAVAEGIVWAVDNGANIINISLTIRETSKDLENAIDYAWENGCIIVAAANLENDSLAYPAYFEKCIAVTVNEEDNMIIPLIDNGHWVDIAAPGARIYSTLPNDSYGIRSGASCSTAFVSGIAALLYSTLDFDSEIGKLNDEVRIAIESNCFDISPWQSQLGTR